MPPKKHAAAKNTTAKKDVGKDNKLKRKAKVDAPSMHTSVDLKATAVSLALSSAQRAALLRWYDANHRVLPWRLTPATSTSKGGAHAERQAAGERQRELMRKFVSKTPSSGAEKKDPAGLDPAVAQDKDVFAYRVWVSEVMLQQTRVAAACEYYTRWVQRWPTVHSLASASIDDVREMWAGLGYYSRAQRLLEGAKLVANEYKGVFPTDAASWHKNMPGVGPYTSAAVSSIVYDEAVPAVDGNVARVMSRAHLIGAPPWLVERADAAGIPRDTSVSPSESPSVRLIDAAVRSHSTAIVTAGEADRPGDINQAIMELGAVVCIPNGQPRCTECPWADSCSMRRAVSAMKPGDLPDGMNIEDLPLLLPYKPEKKKATSGIGNGDVAGTSSKRAKLTKSVSSDLSDGTTEAYAVHIVVARVDGESFVLHTKRPESGLLAGQWEFPAARFAADGAGGEDNVRLAVTALPWDDSSTPWDASKRWNVTTFMAEITHIFSHRTHIYRPRVVVLPEMSSRELVSSQSADVWKALANAAADSETSTAGQARWLPLSDVEGTMSTCTSGVRKIWARYKEML